MKENDQYESDSHSPEEEKAVIDAFFLVARRVLVEGELGAEAIKGMGRMLLRIGGGDRVEELITSLNAVDWDPDVKRAKETSPRET